MALHSLYCADVPLRNCSLTHSSPPSLALLSYVLFVGLYRRHAVQEEERIAAEGKSIEVN